MQVLKLVGLLVAVAVLGVIGVRVSSRFDALLASARSDAAVARQEVQVALGVAAEEVARADAQAQSATRARQAAAKLASDAIKLESEYGRLEVAYKIATRQATDSCEPLIEAADAALAAEKIISARWHSAYDASLQSYDSLAAAFASVGRANGHLVPATENLTRAAERLEKASRKSFFVRFIPRVQIGVMAGADILGRPNAVAGIGLGWSL